LLAAILCASSAAFNLRHPADETGRVLFLGASQETFGTPHISRNGLGAARVQPPGWKIIQEDFENDE
jgi:hypothetical protein